MSAQRRPSGRATPPKRRGLATTAVGLTRLRIATAVSTALVCVTLGLIISCNLRPHSYVLHGLIHALIGLSTYAWMIFPMTPALIMSGMAIVLTLLSWPVQPHSGLGWEALGLVALVLMAGWQQGRRRKQLHQAKQALGTLKEEWRLSDQALRGAVQTHEALTKKLGRYHQLQAIAEQLSRLVNLEQILQLTIDRAFDLIGKSDAGLLLLVDRQHQQLALHTSRKASEVGTIRSKQGDQFDHYVLRTQRPLLVNDARRDFRFQAAQAPEAEQAASADVERSIGSVIACPITAGQTLEGVLRLDGPQPGLYTQDDLRLMNILLDLVDTALVNARLFSQTQELAITDGLTGAYRRQPFMDYLERELARSLRSGEPLSVLMLDIDDFKRYNDAFGHTAGDVVLKMVAELARGSTPPHGLTARYGGEEFAVLLPKIARSQVIEIADRIRGLVTERVHVGSQSPQTSVTVSIGVASFPEDGQVELELIRRADQRLYQAKRDGKNRVCS